MWSPSRYMKFAGPRLRPALDLLNQTIKVVSINQNPNEIKKILDFGCGPGNITQFLDEAFPNSNILGVDSSAEMIKTANDIHKNKTNIKFNINTFEQLSTNCNEQYDLIYTNAALHWSLNHEILFPNLINNLLKSSKDNNNIGGILSVQMPDTRKQDSHLLMEKAVDECGYGEIMKYVRIPRTEKDMYWYYKFLKPLCGHVDMWTSEYMQVLPVVEEKNSRHPVLEYTRSTGLQPIITALGGEDSEKGVIFLNKYEELLYNSYPFHNDSEYKYVLFPFKRFFIICQKK